MKGEALGNTVTKHEQIIRYIKSLEIGKKVSVRQIAKAMEVSEGTAYRAIKEAEAQGFVSSIPKVGTIRLADAQSKEFEEYTLKEIATIIEGEVLSAKDNLSVAPTGFVVGCYSRLEIQDSLGPDALLVVGNLPDLQKLALEKNCHLLIIGAAKVDEDIIRLGEEKGRVILSSPYDAFEALSLMNRAVYERLTERELVYVEDIMMREPHYLMADATVERWHAMAQSTGHSRFPVVDQNMLVIGIITALDVAGIEKSASILSVMTTGVLTVGPKTLVTHLSRVLLWEGYELVPITEEGRLVGVISRQDILKAFQQMQRHPHIGETVDNLVMSGFKLEEWDEGIKIAGEITQFMINEYGTASPGTLVTMVTTSAYIAARKQLRADTYLENLTFHHLEPVAIGEVVEVFAKILHHEKKSCTLEVSLYVKDVLRARALIVARIVKK